MNGLKISFVLSKIPAYGISYKENRKTFEFEAFDGRIDLAIRYDFHRNPLVLRADIQCGERVEVILLPHRIELYVNGVLADEEWPKGERLFAYGDDISSNLQTEISEYEEETAIPPSVISCFTGAEGWYPGDGVFVGDCMPYERDGEYHVLYLKDRHHHASKWCLGAHQWEHISTKDFVHWSVHPTAVPITDPSEGSICTGSWIRNGNIEYLFYTVRIGTGIPAPIRRSISCDGYHFEKDSDFGFTLPDTYHASGARDPKIVWGEDGLFHMFLTTALTKDGKGCLAHFVSTDLDDWRDTGKPIYISADSAQPECPDYFVYNGRYYLIYSLHGKAHYAVSDRPFEGFVEPEDSVIPCESVPKGAIWRGRIVFAGFRRMGGYAGSMTFKSASATSNGKLIFT
jgi:hypothetical protein